MPFLLSLFLFLISCSDDVLYNEAAPRIFVEILNNSDTILAGETVRFQAVISPSPEDVEFFWVIENSTNYPVFNSNLLFERNFGESGLYSVKFNAKDNFSDIYRDSLFIRVSNAPVCEGFSITIFQGSPTFEWNCVDKDENDPLTYKLSLFNRYGYLFMDTTLTQSSLQLGYALEANDEIQLIATNKYGIETHLDSVWSSL